MTDQLATYKEIGRHYAAHSEYTQVLLNIILNARDALLEHEIDQPRITVSSFIENAKAIITITDKAGGVPEEILDRTFLPPRVRTKGPVSACSCLKLLSIKRWVAD